MQGMPCGRGTRPAVRCDAHSMSSIRQDVVGEIGHVDDFDVGHVDDFGLHGGRGRGNPAPTGWCGSLHKT